MSALVKSAIGNAGEGAHTRAGNAGAPLPEISNLRIALIGYGEVGGIFGADFGPDEADAIAIFSVKPVVISVLDYRNGIGHTELVTIETPPQS